MSFAFSRRSFLKYTAAAAVAVAGASLFTGCKIDTSDSYNALRTTPGELTVLQVTAAMGTYVEASKSYTGPDDVTGTTIVFPFKITNGRANPIYVNPNNFKATVLDAEGKVILAKYTASNGLSLEPSLCDTNLKKDASVSGKVKVTLSAALEPGQSIVLTYCPDLQYNEYSLNWKTTRPKD
ncbi:MAG: twin-arginine translocation signal domain-containing protein [Faecalibacterium prausnitzii]|nr:twin-arginine translocation signal domain-containing protein [Faecalibacterium prausnitzii]